MRTLNFICQTEGFKVQKSKLHSKLNRNHLFSINFLRNRSPLEANFHQNTINPMHLTTLLLYKVKKSKVYFQLFLQNKTNKSNFESSSKILFKNIFFGKRILNIKPQISFLCNQTSVSILSSKCTYFRMRDSK